MPSREMYRQRTRNQMRKVSRYIARMLRRRKTSVSTTGVQGSGGITYRPTGRSYNRTSTQAMRREISGAIAGEQQSGHSLREEQSHIEGQAPAPLAETELSELPIPESRQLAAVAPTKQLELGDTEAKRAPKPGRFRKSDSVRRLIENAPGEVIRLILSYVPPGDRQDAAMGLSLVASAQRDSCLKAVHNALTITDTTSSIQFQWLQNLASNQLEQLDASLQNSFLGLHGERILDAKLQFASSQKAEILHILENSIQLWSLSCISNMVPNIKHLTSLRKLSLSVLQAPQMLQGLYAALRSLDLHELTIICTAPHPGASLTTHCSLCNHIPDCETMTYLHYGIKARGSVCPNLTALDVQCVSRAYVQPYYFEIVSNFPMLQDITLHTGPKHCIEHGNLHLLQHIPNVHLDLRASIDASCLAPLGWRVRSIIWDYPLAEMSQLYPFPNVETLDITVDKNCDLKLVGLTQRTENLRINWSDVEEPQLDWVWRTEGTPYNVSREAITSLIQDSPNLVHLTLNFGGLRISVLRDILKAAGWRLKSFATCLTYQHESAIHRLIHLIKLVYLFCPFLEKMEIVDEKRIDAHVGLVLPLTNLLQLESRFLKRRTPTLDLTSVENCIRSMSTTKLPGVNSA